MLFRFFRKSSAVVRLTSPVELDPALLTRVSGGVNGPHGGWTRPAGTIATGAAARSTSADVFGPHGGWRNDLFGPHGGW